jgi:hypothetical protein
VIVVINVELKNKKLNISLDHAQNLNMLVEDIQEVDLLQDIGIVVNQVAHGLPMLVLEMKLDNVMLT